GRGNIKPSYNTCPRCGVRLIDGGGGMFNPPPPPNFNGGFNPPPAPTDPDLMPRGSGAGVAAPPATHCRSSDYFSSSESKSNAGSLILKIMAGVIGFLFLVGIIGGVVLLVAANKGSKPRKKSRCRHRDEDDDDYDD